MDLKRIKKIELEHKPEIKQGAMQDGLPLAPRPDLYAFVVTFDDKTSVTVPNDPSNKDYREVREWVASRKKAPFDFDFAPDPEPEEPDESVPPNRSRLQPAVAANQTEDADLPDINLTQHQQKEIFGS